MQLKKSSNLWFLCLWIFSFFPLPIFSYLCFPLENKRAYVTSYLGTSENLLKIEVLKKSLRKSGSKSSPLVIFVPEKYHTEDISQIFTSANGYQLHVIREKLLEKFTPRKLRKVLPLWSYELYQYDRVIYLDPYSIAIRNIDIMFSCSGYCASQYATDGPIVLHPVKDTHAYLLQLFSSGKTNIFSELSQFYNLAHCPSFVDEVDPGKVCTDSEFSLVSQATCHQLPLNYAVPSTHFTTSSFTNELVCSDCGFDKVKLIVYPEYEPSYEAFFFTEKAIHYRWQAVRSLLPISSRDILSACAAYLASLVLIFGMLWSHRRGTIIATFAASAEPTGSSPTTTADSEIGYEPPPSSSIAGLRISSVPTVKLMCQGLVVTVLVSLWYHLSLIVSKSVLCFLWEPNVSLAVSFIWMNLSLFTGLQLIDYTYLMLQCAPRLMMIEGGIFIILFWTIGMMLPIPDRHLIFPIAVAFLSASLSVAYLSRFGSMKDKWFVKKFGPPTSSVTPYCGPLVTKEDISLLLVFSLGYYLFAMSSTLLTFPDSLRSLILRSVTMIHAAAVICLFVSIIFGNGAPAPGDSSVILSLKEINPFNLSRLRISSCQPPCSLLDCLLCLLRRPFLLLLAIILIVFATVYYILFISHQATLPPTSPYFCLKQKGVYVNPNGGISPMCGAAEALSIYDTGLYSETFAQHYVCLEAAPSHREIMRSSRDSTSSSGSSSSLFPDSSLVLTGLKSPTKRKFLTYHRTTTSTCSSASQFFFTNVLPNQIEDGLGYCIYNPLHGVFLSSKIDGEMSCQRTEMWTVEPSHRWTHLWSVLGKITSPLRYDFTHQRPVISLVFFALSLLCLRKLPLSLNQRASFAIFLLTLAIFLLHYGALQLLWGSHKYAEARDRLTSLLSATISRLGLPNGPQFLRLVSTTPEQCPESVWLASLVLLTSDFIALITFLCLGMFRYSTARGRNSSKSLQPQSQQQPPPQRQSSRRDLQLLGMHKQKSLSDLSDMEPPSPRRIRQVSSNSNISDFLPLGSGHGDEQETNQSKSSLELLPSLIESPEADPEADPFSLASPVSSDHEGEESSPQKDRFAYKYSLASVIVSYIASALMLEAISSLVTPFQSLGTHPSSKSSCRYYEQRFHLLGYEQEYVDTVVVVSFVLFHVSWRYGRSRFVQVLGMGLALVTWVLVWLTVDIAYIVLPLKCVIIYASWQYAVPRCLQHISLLVNDNEGREVII